MRLFGIRDEFEEDRAELTALKIPVVTVGHVREWGADAPPLPEGRGRCPHARAAAQAFEIPQLAGFWVHLDADVLDPIVMPAVDSPDPHGLVPDELIGLPRPLLASPHCVGLNVTIYDPDLDPDGTAGALLTDIVVAAFPGASGSSGFAES